MRQSSSIQHKALTPQSLYSMHLSLLNKSSPLTIQDHLKNVLQQPEPLPQPTTETVSLHSSNSTIEDSQQTASTSSSKKLHHTDSNCNAVDNILKSLFLGDHNSNQPTTAEAQVDIDNQPNAETQTGNDDQPYSAAESSAPASGLRDVCAAGASEPTHQPSPATSEQDHDCGSNIRCSRSPWCPSDVSLPKSLRRSCVQVPLAPLLLVNGFLPSFLVRLSMRTMRLSVRLSNSKMDVKHGTAFIHFTSIDSAIRAKACLSADPHYLDLQVCFGKDRCAKFGMIRMKACTGLTVAIIESVLEEDVLQDILTVEGRRNVYLGNISSDTTAKKIYNVISGGMLSHIHHQPPSTFTNVAFVDPDAATNNGAKIMERQVEVHWNDDWPRTLSPDMNHALRRGATGELFVNNVPRLRSMSTDKLLHEFSMFGTVEKVRWYWHWNFAFVSFSNIASATAAIQGIKEAKPEYELNKCRIDYAFQDRCARPLTPNTNTNTHKVRSEAYRTARRAARRA